MRPFCKLKMINPLLVGFEDYYSPESLIQVNIRLIAVTLRWAASNLQEAIARDGRDRVLRIQAGEK